MESTFNAGQGAAADASIILESITDAFFALDRNWTFTYVNRQAESLLGRTRDELRGKALWAEFPGLIGSEFETLYRDVTARQVAGSITAWYQDHQRYYEVHAYPSPLGISVYFRNASARIQAQERLRESELRFRLMADAIPQIVWIVGADGNAEFFNRQWSTYTGVDLRTITPAAVSQSFVHPDDHAATMLAWEQAQRDGSVFSVEHRIRSASGEYRWFLVRAEPYRDPDSGEILRWFGTSTDVHDRKLAEAALRKSEARYRSLFESIDEGFCIIDLIFDANGTPCDYRFREVNAVFAQQTGLRDAVGRTMREFAPEHEQHWFDIYGKVAVTGEPIRFQNEAKSLNRWYDVYAFRVDEPDARRVAVLFNDITGRRRNEQDLRVSARRKDDFLAMLAHELRNPLAPITAAADLIAAGNVSAEKLPQVSAIIVRQARHMTELLEDLLDVARVTRGQVSLDDAMVDLKAVIAEAVEQVRPLTEEKSHRLEVHLSAEPALVRGDRKRLVQVLANLLGNAAKYTPAGEGLIVLRLAVDPATVRLAVSDNGIGMSPGLITRAFDLFAQGERTSDRAQGGLGIGLALVRNLLTLHGGAVSIESGGAGRGTTFHVTLPRLLQATEPEPAAQAEGIAGRVPLRILVVDDNADAARMLAMLLQVGGHQVHIGHHAREALALAPEIVPHVCLLDIGLPDIDGNALVRRLRAMPQLSGTVFAALTGYGQPQDREASSAAGFHRHLVKPVDSAGLLAWLDTLQIPAN
ncbi:MAG TPA: PAS domain S-box protein [Noviherbaspirillum sp.]|uniref:PAS domain S-box protein n=1 Tax=Noviherbaspirillum sp. TaxID=1926288 RepID=UPI002F92FD1B